MQERHSSLRCAHSLSPKGDIVEGKKVFSACWNVLQNVTCCEFLDAVAETTAYAFLESAKVSSKTGNVRSGHGGSGHDGLERSTLVKTLARIHVALPHRKTNKATAGSERENCITGSENVHHTANVGEIGTGVEG